MTSAANTTFRDLGEESFHKIEPTSAGGREVDMVARVANQPVRNLGNFVGPVVVHNRMNVQVFGQVGFDLAEEP